MWSCSQNRNAARPDKFSADDIFKYVSHFVFREKKIRHFMQIVSNGENIHEISNPVFWENKKKYHPRFRLLRDW